MIVDNPRFFEQPDVADYYCRLRKITEDKTLTIEVFKTNVGGKRYLIQFEDVIAIKIPILWKIPVFEFASEFELLALARTINDDRLRNLSDSYLISLYTLYKFRPAVDSMYILAGKVSVQEKTRKPK